MHEPVSDFDSRLARAFAVSRAHFGHSLSLHIPGMFVVNGRRGKYRAVSITGDDCELDCEHCKGSLLKTMAHALTPEELIRIGRETEARGDVGMLVTGGCDRFGRLPWDRFLPAIAQLKSTTNLKISVHAGQTDRETALDLKSAGVDQALVDVLGDDPTARDVYHLPDGVDTIRRTMESLLDVGLDVVPHILFGIRYGRESGERHALGMLKDYGVKRYVVVVLMPTKGTPMASVRPPSAETVAGFIAEARLEMPGAFASLGCARPRGRYRRDLDVLAVRAGVNAIALPSDQAVAEAERLGLKTEFHGTCCSLASMGSS